MTCSGATTEDMTEAQSTELAVPDVEAALQKAESLGGTRTMGPDEPMEGLEIGMFADPEGHVVGLVKGSE